VSSRGRPQKIGIGPLVIFHRNVSFQRGSIATRSASVRSSVTLADQERYTLLFFHLFDILCRLQWVKLIYVPFSNAGVAYLAPWVERWVVASEIASSTQSNTKVLFLF